MSHLCIRIRQSQLCLYIFNISNSRPEHTQLQSIIQSIWWRYTTLGIVYIFLVVTLCGCSGMENDVQRWASWHFVYKYICMIVCVCVWTPFGQHTHTHIHTHPNTTAALAKMRISPLEDTQYAYIHTTSDIYPDRRKAVEWV